MIQFCVTILLSASLGGSIKINIVSQNGLNFIQEGGDISLSCSFSSPEESSTAWFKQTPGEKPLLITSAYHSGSAVYHYGFDKSGRFIASRQKNSFSLNILNAEPSDSATYFCSVSYYTQNALSDWNLLVIKGESDPGIIFTHGNRSDQCKKSSETVSPTQSCIYKLPKNNLSLSDAGTYYCAVAACGEIISGEGAQVEFVENSILVQSILVLASSTIISMVTALILCIKLHSSHYEGSAAVCAFEVKQVASNEALTFSEGGFTIKPQQMNKDPDVYSHVIYY